MIGDPACTGVMYLFEEPQHWPRAKAICRTCPLYFDGSCEELAKRPSSVNPGVVRAAESELVPWNEPVFVWAGVAPGERDRPAATVNVGERICARSGCGEEIPPTRNRKFCDEHRDMAKARPARPCGDCGEMLERGSQRRYCATCAKIRERRRYALRDKKRRANVSGAMSRTSV